MPSTLPVLILTGYLGSGKTTVLNHFLATGGARIGVIINDFGDVNVDAALVAGHVAEPVSIAGGCLCCIEDPRQLDDALRCRIFGRPERPAVCRQLRPALEMCGPVADNGVHAMRYLAQLERATRTRPA